MSILKWVYPLFTVAFSLFCIQAGNENMHELLDTFEFGQIGPLTTNVAAACSCLKYSYRLVLGQWRRHVIFFIFDRLIT